MAKASFSHCTSLQHAGVILSCTEITMMIGQADLDLPVFATARIHAEAAINFAPGAGA